VPLGALGDVHRSQVKPFVFTWITSKTSLFK
jgi:hypothetical protein